MKRLGEAMTENPGRFVGRPLRVAGDPRAGRPLASRTGGQSTVWMDDADLHAAGAKEMTNWEGRRVIVFPLFWMHGEPHYPPVHLEPGEQRRVREAEMNAAYSAYRRDKGKSG
jgi:hypothetical protein